MTIVRAGFGCSILFWVIQSQGLVSMIVAVTMRGASMYQVRTVACRLMKKWEKMNQEQQNSFLFFLCFLCEP
jgi:hypothetical protein